MAESIKKFDMANGRKYKKHLLINVQPLFYVCQWYENRWVQNALGYKVANCFFEIYYKKIFKKNSFI